jgi:hypothetical protein
VARGLFRSKQDIRLGKPEAGTSCFLLRKKWELLNADEEIKSNIWCRRPLMVKKIMTKIVI